MAPRIIALMVLALGAHPGWGTEVAAPPITESNLIGTWEGTSGAFWYWYRFEIFPGGGYLAYLTSPEKQDQAIYRLEHLSVTKGKVSLRFRNITKGSSLPEAIGVDGVGWVDGDTGVLGATVTDYVVNLREKSHVTFEKGTPTRQLAKMFKDAERLINDAKHRRP